MNTYSIVKAGKDYVVRANDRAVIKFTSRRRAARVVADATDLLRGVGREDRRRDPEQATVPSMARDRLEVP